MPTTTSVVLCFYSFKSWYYSSGIYQFQFSFDVTIIPFQWMPVWIVPVEMAPRVLMESQTLHVSVRVERLAIDVNVSPCVYYRVSTILLYWK